MKWREPWRSTLRRQEPWKLATWAHCRNAMVWAVALLVIFGLQAYAANTPLSDFMSRSWIVPVGAVGLTLLISFGHWLSPLEVDSGPRGIVRSKGEALALVPWEAILAYRIYELEGERVLDLSVNYSTEPERFYLSKKVDAGAIEQELRAHVQTPHTG